MVPAVATELESARAISAALADDLRAVGVHDLRELEAIGGGEAWERLLAADLRDSLADRLALEAAVRGRRVAALDPETRERCAAHVRRRVAPEPPAAAPRASGLTVGRPAPITARERRQRRIVYWSLAGVALLLAAAIVVAVLSQ
jgi:TfoX C-terminal domain